MSVEDDYGAGCLRSVRLGDLRVGAQRRQSR